MPLTYYQNHNMNRREFLKGTAAATVLLGLPSFASVFTQKMPHRGLMPQMVPGVLASISPALQANVDTVFDWIRQNGWAAYLETFNIKLPASTDVNALTYTIETGILQKIVNTPGFEDFAGNKLIEPGFPAMSLLYHALANPRVKPAGFSASQYPELAQLDLLEDYVYALLNWSAYQQYYDISGTNDLVLAVFAYEYRTAFKTPHHQHADMVFSRTGIGRIGTHPGRYDRLNRCYTNNPSGQQGDKHIAVIPARYGLFIAKKVPYHDQQMSILTMPKTKPDDDFYMTRQSAPYLLLPVRKIFNNDLLAGSAALNFSERHESSKIARLLKDDSVVRASQDLTQMQNLNSCVLIGSLPAPLITPMKHAGNPGQVRTYKAVQNIVPHQDNRYFTAYFNDTIVGKVEDVDIIRKNGMTRISNQYENPRNSPMYVNITHQASGAGTVYLERTADKDAFEKMLKAERITPLYEDKICDGRVGADIVISSGPLKDVSDKGIISAFSIITAPDFLPQVDCFDFVDFDIAPGRSTSPSLFYEGGIASLANCVMPPNPMVYQQDKPALQSFNPKYSYTAVISVKQKAVVPTQGKPNFSSPETDKSYIFSSYLPDMCSSVFAPGWDVTYSAPRLYTKKDVFLSTQGLGSPFVEDMKLCAAMNGMWPAASPDASRTYQGSVTKDQNGDWERNPTAVPLMDEEIGFADASPAVLEYKRSATYGWDGEQGPYVEASKESTPTTWYINFTDLGRADYIENALNDRFDMSRLRQLDSKEVYRRMACMRLCVNAIEKKYIPNGNNSLWLVSAEKAGWPGKANGYGVPKGLLSQPDNAWATIPRDGLNKEGYLYIFGRFIPDVSPADVQWVSNGNYTKRRRVLCTKLYICQVCEGKVAYYEINPASATAYDASHWKLAGA